MLSRRLGAYRLFYSPNSGQTKCLLFSTKTNLGLHHLSRANPDRRGWGCRRDTSLELRFRQYASSSNCKSRSWRYRDITRYRSVIVVIIGEYLNHVFVFVTGRPFWAAWSACARWRWWLPLLKFNIEFVFESLPGVLGLERFLGFSVSFRFEKNFSALGVGFWDDNFLIVVVVIVVWTLWRLSRRRCKCWWRRYNYYDDERIALICNKPGETCNPLWDLFCSTKNRFSAAIALSSRARLLHRERDPFKLQAWTGQSRKRTC